MSPDRTPPIEPGGAKHVNSNTKAEREAKQKVEKVREVDPDEQTKQQRRDKFQSFLNTPDKENSARAPSPFETDFYNNNPTERSRRPIDKMKDTQIPNPTNTPPPNLSQPLPTKEIKHKDEEALPHSQTFWVKTDLPPDRPLSSPTYKEKVSVKENVPVTKPTEKEKGEAIVALPGAPLEKIAAPISLPKKEEEKEGKKVKKETESALPSSLPAVASKEGRGGHKDQGKQSQKVFQLDPSLLSRAPREIQHTAQVATQQASSYLNPDTASLFYQMVGTIYLSLPPGSGINQTVIVLNQAAFANSKFFGATITIEKYATAPDALNIRLTGTNQAVVAFRENIPNLMNAFQNSKMPFKVNRIDTEFTTERPLFHRKGDKGRSELNGGMGENQK